MLAVVHEKSGAAEHGHRGVDHCGLSAIEVHHDERGLTGRGCGTDRRLGVVGR